MNTKFKKMDGNDHNAQSTVSNLIELILLKAEREGQSARYTHGKALAVGRNLLQSQSSNFEQALLQQPRGSHMPKDTCPMHQIGETYRPHSARIDHIGLKRNLSKKVSIFREKNMHFNLRISSFRVKPQGVTKPKKQSQTKRSLLKLEDQLNMDDSFEKYFNVLRIEKLTEEGKTKEINKFQKSVELEKISHDKTQKKFIQYYQNRKYCYTPNGDVTDIEEKSLKRVKNNRYHLISNKMKISKEKEQQAKDTVVNYNANWYETRVKPEEIQLQTINAFFASEHCRYEIVANGEQ